MKMNIQDNVTMSLSGNKILFAMLFEISLFAACEKEGIDFAFICAADPASISKFSEVYKMHYPVYFADDIELISRNNIKCQL